MAKHTLNLLQADLLPEQPLLSLNRVAGLCGLALIIMITWGVIGHYQIKNLTVKHNALRAETSKNESLLAKLENQLSQRKADPALESKLATLKLVMANKKALYSQLTDSSRTFVTGFASAMTELSNMHHSGISLEKVNINHDDMTFSGTAKSPDAVPEWLAGFEDSVLLSGKAFINFKLEENEQKYTDFVVSSKPELEGE